MNAPPENGASRHPGQGDSSQLSNAGSGDGRDGSATACHVQGDGIAHDVLIPAHPQALVDVEFVVGVEHEHDADYLRETCGIRAFSFGEPTWQQHVQPGDQLLLIGKMQRQAGDLRVAFGVKCWGANVPLPYQWPLEFLEARAQASGYEVTKAGMRELWRMVEDRASSLDDVEPTGHPDLQPKPKLPRMVSWQDVTELPPPAWQIENILAREVLALIVGAPEAGKSLQVLDWAFRMAHGMDWRGRKIRAGSVLYLAGEGHAGLAGRLRALRAANPGARQLHGQFFVIADSIPILSTPAGVALLRQMVEQLVAEHGHPPDLIVVDTLSQSFGDGDENDARTVAPSLRALSDLRTRFHCSVLVVHHLAKGPQGQKQTLTLASVRGSSALTANVDTVVGIDVQDDVRRLVLLKMKDGEKPAPILSSITAIETGIALEDGRVERCPILVPAEAPVAEDAPIDSDRQVLAVLRSAGLEGATRAQVVKLSGLNDSTAWDSLNRLHKDRAVELQKGKPVRYWLAEFSPLSGEDPAKIRPDVPPDQPAGEERSDDPDDPARPVGAPDRITGSSERAEDESPEEEADPTLAAVQRDMGMLDRVRMMAFDLLRERGLQGHGWTFAFGKLKQADSDCSIGRRLIRLSHAFATRFSIAAVRDRLLIEIGKATESIGKETKGRRRKVGGAA